MLEVHQGRVLGHAQGLGQGAGPLGQLRRQPLSHLLRQGQHRDQPGDLPHQGQAAVLEHVTPAAALGAAHEFASAHGDLVGAGHLEAGRGDIPARPHVPARLVRGHAQPVQPGQEPVAQAQVGIHDPAGHAGLVGGGGHGVGELVRVQDGPAAGGPPHHVVAQALHGRHVDLVDRLVAPQAHCGRLPAVEAQGGRRLPCGAGQGDGLVHGHVGRARAGLRLQDQPPTGSREALRRCRVRRRLRAMGWVHGIHLTPGRAGPPR